jgi:hypothetical protein
MYTMVHRQHQCLPRTIISATAIPITHRMFILQVSKINYFAEKID